MNNLQETNAIRELTSAELDSVAGGNPLVAVVATAVAEYLVGKVVDGVVEESGLLKPVIDWNHLPGR